MREKQEKKRNKKVIDKVCPSCGWNKMFTNRGELFPVYSLKCTKCGHLIK